MSFFQKIIKALAIALAISIMIGIASIFLSIISLASSETDNGKSFNETYDVIDKIEIRVSTLN